MAPRDFHISITLLYDKGDRKRSHNFAIQEVHDFSFLIHQPGCRFIIVLMVCEVSPSIGHQRRGLLYHLSASRQTGEKGFLRDPHPHEKPGSRACQSIIFPARAILLTFWEAAILRSPVDFKLMTFCFPYFQNRHRANLSFPGQ